MMTDGGTQARQGRGPGKDPSELQRARLAFHMQSERRFADHPKRFPIAVGFRLFQLADVLVSVLLSQLRWLLRHGERNRQCAFRVKGPVVDVFAFRFANKSIRERCSLQRQFAPKIHARVHGRRACPRDAGSALRPVGEMTVRIRLRLLIDGDSIVRDCAPVPLAMQRCAIANGTGVYAEQMALAESYDVEHVGMAMAPAMQTEAHRSCDAR